MVQLGAQFVGRSFLLGVVLMGPNVEDVGQRFDVVRPRPQCHVLLIKINDTPRVFAAVARYKLARVGLLIDEDLWHRLGQYLSARRPVLAL